MLLYAVVVFADVHFEASHVTSICKVGRECRNEGRDGEEVKKVREKEKKMEKNKKNEKK